MKKKYTVEELRPSMVRYNVHRIHYGRTLREKVHDWCRPTNLREAVHRWVHSSLGMTKNG